MSRKMDRTAQEVLDLIFDHVTFAIYCPSSDKSILEAFQETFKKGGNHGSQL
jgi:hypothetical protein